MRNRKAAALGCTALLITAMMTGCAAKGNDSLAATSQVSESTARTTMENTQNGKTDESSQAEKGEQETGTQYGSVTAVDGNKITADLGKLDTAMPGGEAPNGDNSDREAPSADKPEGEAPSTDKSEGNAPGEMPGGNGGFGGSTFTASGESVTFNVTDDTEITVEFLQGSSEGTIDDIAVGSVLEFELDNDKNATKITVKNLNAGNGFGGSSEVTNGTAANTITEDTSVSTATYTSDGDDENALRVDGATNGNSATAIRSDRGGGTVNVTLDDTSTWTLTADSYVTSFTGELANITANGYHLYVNGEQAI